MNKDNPQSNTDWRERVLEEMNARRVDGKTYIDSEWLLSQLLEAEKKRWREEVEQLRKTPYNEERESVAIYYNQALDAVLQKLS